MSTRWDFQLVTPFAINGDKSVIPELDQITSKVNYDKGFTDKYSTPVRDGGYNVERLTFNELFYKLSVALLELQSKTTQTQHGVTPQGLDYSVTNYPDDTLIIDVFGEYLIPPGAGSSINGNTFQIDLPYFILIDRVTATITPKLPTSTTGSGQTSIDTILDNVIKLNIKSYSATEFIRCYLQIKAVVNKSKYPRIPKIVSSNTVNTVATITWQEPEE